jgi:hypothetical protein
MSERRIEAAVLEQLRAAAGDELPVVARRLQLGSSGTRTDLAVLGDAFIGFSIRGSGEPIDDLPETLAIQSCYFEHLVAVVDPSHAAVLDPDGLAGAALWTVDAGGTIEALSAGAGGEVAYSAWFDLLPPEVRRDLLRPVLARAEAPTRGEPPLPPSEFRRAFEESFTARHRDDSGAFWSTVGGRAITPADVTLLDVGPPPLLLSAIV